MSNTRYIELDSTYRNRNEWPLASQFEIPIAQSGRKNKEDALDPVSMAYPLFAWTSNLLDINSTITPTPTPTISGLFYTGEPLTNTADGSSLVIYTLLPSALQQYEDYYVGLLLTVTTISPLTSRRVSRYRYLGSDGVHNRGLIELESRLPSNFDQITDLWSISDPSDVDYPLNPIIFVPSGRVQYNAYTGDLLYNETRMQSRPIKAYDAKTQMLTLKMDAGPVPTWTTTDNYSIRHEIPIVPSNTAYPTIVSNTTSTITCDSSSNLSPTIGFYNKLFIRILPEQYIYSTTPANDTYVTVINYTGSSGTNPWTFYVNPLISGSLVGRNIEILNFSFDNLNPFSYTGSLVSQQEMVCYEVELISLILPNYLLAVGQGSRIAYYPYLYCTLSNVSSAGAGLKNIIYSNNPNSTSAIFRCPIDDVTNPNITAFTKIDSGGQTQTIKFKPNDNLYFAVYLAGGEFFETTLPEYYSPSPPNYAAQISSCFAIRRV